jgi:hypothetical protein
MAVRIGKNSKVCEPGIFPASVVKVQSEDETVAELRPAAPTLAARLTWTGHPLSPSRVQSSPSLSS